ncbi:MAG: exodeoxyribonuclease V subunit gamma [Lachnospiraceae bacterium]|nr:exodeoxyribonuclease V subunit gamma [Lachnospiraceae bacterium]
MALQIITGGSGSGKSKYVCDRILCESNENSKKNYFVIVPDQFTMQTQMDFVTASDKGGIMNIDILSFSRLAHRIFEETGGNRKPVLDDTGKSLILRKIAGGIKEQVPVIGSNLNKQGYIHEVKSAISEFMQYGIGQNELDEMIEYAKSRGALHYKLKDLQVLYKAFKEYIEGHYITTEESMDLLAAELRKSALIPGSVVVFDGFTGFTPIQEKVIGVLLTLCEQVIITVTMDGEEEPFSFAAKTVERLKRLAGEYGCEVLPLQHLSGNYRAAGSPQLLHLEKQLFRYPLVAFQAVEGGEDKAGSNAQSVRISAHKDMQQEVRYLCRQVRALLNETGCAYRDIAVIAGDLGAYESVIEEEFIRYEIPYFMDKTRNILLNPVIEYIKAALSVLTENFSYESVFHYLRSGLADFDAEEIDDLENYVLELGVRGKSMWTHAFAGRTLAMKKAENAVEVLEALNTTRERLLNQLAPILEVRSSSDICVKDMVEHLYSFVTANRVEEKLHAYADFFEKKKDDARAKEYRQIYRLIMELFDQIMELIGQEKMSLSEFADILDAGFAEIEVGIIPRSVDRIIVGDIERTRLKPVKYLFFVGVNDGYIPAKTNKGGIISDIDREFLKGSNQDLAPSPREQMYIQKYYLYLNMTKPSKGLYLSYAAMDGQGTALRPSYLIGIVKQLFPGCETDGRSTQGDLAIGNLFEAKEAFCLLLRKYAENSISDKEREQFIRLLHLLGKEESDRLLLNHLVENAYLTNKERSISQTAAGLLYGDIILSSISRMEKYASCAYSYFLQYGLSLKERELYGFESKDMGTIFHGVLEHFSNKLLEKNYTWTDFPADEGEAMVAESMQEVCMEYTDALLYDNALNRYTMKNMEHMMQKCVSNISYQLGKGRFVPKEYEVSFHVVENLKDLDISLSDKDKMRLSGRIDRMDTCEKEDKVFVKIVDYKSGDKNFDLAAFYHGTQLQLVVYMNEALKRAEKLHPGKEAVSAAMLYYHVDDPVVEGTVKMSPEEVNGKVREALRMKGVINSDGDILEALDTTKSAKSDCVTLDYDSKGGLKSTTNALNSEQMKLLSDYASYSLKAMGAKIKKGEIPVNPYASGNVDACEYCAYKDVCGFDEKIPGYTKRNLSKDKDVDYLELMKDTMGEK